MFKYEGVEYVLSTDPRAAKVCAKGFTTSGGPCIIHRNTDYPVWQLPRANSTFPCSCGRKELNQQYQATIELILTKAQETLAAPKETTALVPVVKNPTVIQGFLQAWRRYEPPPKLVDISGEIISEELEAFNEAPVHG